MANDIQNAFGLPEDNKEVHTLLEQALIAKTKRYLENKALKAIQEDIEQIATDAVKSWVEFRVAQVPDMMGMEMNINIQFIEKVIRTEMKDHPIKITVNSDKGK